MEAYPLGAGVELLLSDVYDSAFPTHPSVRSVAHTNVYRVLQRRMLGVRLALTGTFRCKRLLSAASLVFSWFDTGNWFCHDYYALFISANSHTFA